MEKRMKKFVIISLVIVIILFSITSFFLSYGLPDFGSEKEQVLNAPAEETSISSVSLQVIGGPFINITSPLNLTYNFNKGDIYNFDLNVSANFNGVNWRYDLFDARHGIPKYTNVAFPGVLNTSFEAVRWSNFLTVYADNADVLGETISANVSFYVNVSNSNPYLGPMNSSLYVCEGSFLSYYFNATDVDEDPLTIDINAPSGLFFTAFFANVNFTTNTYDLFSGVLGKVDTGFYPNNIIRAADALGADTKSIDITVIEINNPPTIIPVGVQTVWTIGDNATFYHELNVVDVEDGNRTDGILGFNISITNSSGSPINLFNISSTGVMNFTADFFSTFDTYDVIVCVNDTGILVTHPFIFGVCGQTGNPIASCTNFQLTVTDKNRPPTIVDFYPSNWVLNVNGDESVFFNITEYDPDGTTPDAYWYISNTFLEYDTGFLIDNLTYVVPCGISGTYKLTVEITDGLLNDSKNWSLDVTRSSCPRKLSSGGGGGGGSRISCNSKWGCQDWNVCQNAQRSLELGILVGNDYRELNEICEISFVESDKCGFQLRSCGDVNNCTIPINKPEEDQYCYYIDDPSCRDKIKNCHDDSCELLADCGGPCDPCPTCSDSIRNQEEGGIDCGGPCPWICPEKQKLTEQNWFLYGIMGLLFFLIIFAIWKIIKIYRLRRSEETPSS